MLEIPSHALHMIVDLSGKIEQFFVSDTRKDLTSSLVSVEQVNFVRSRVIDRFGHKDMYFFSAGLSFL